MNTEQIECELANLKGRPVIVITPIRGKASFSFCADLAVVETEDHMVGFHLSVPGIALIFYADDVLRLENSKQPAIAKLIRLKE